MASSINKNLENKNSGVDVDVVNMEEQNSNLAKSSSVAPSGSVGMAKKKMGVTFAEGTTAGNVGSLRSQPPGQPRRTLQQKKKTINANNIKKENLVMLIQKKKECERQAHEVVLRLIETGVEKKFLLDNAIRISKQHLEDVIEERKLAQICGWVLCDNPLDPKDIPKQTYSIKGHKVYDITERKAFCNGKCYAKATHFKAQLLTSPLWLRDMEEDVQFEILEDSETTVLHGLNVALTSVHLSDDDSEEENNDDEVEHVTKPS